MFESNSSSENIATNVYYNEIGSTTHPSDNIAKYVYYNGRGSTTYPSESIAKLLPQQKKEIR